ncbi:MAG: pilus assembly protein PilM [Planctomycetes bacterium]|nr:pilus assembly protein PilM [Planctomycetota bacterium]
MKPLLDESIWGIDLGVTCMRVVRLTRRGNGYEVAEIDRIDYYINPAKARPDEFDAAMRKALSLFVANHKIPSRDRVGVSIPGVGFEALRLQMPAVSAERTRELIDYEIRRRTSHAGHEVIYGIQAVPSPGLEERRFVAVVGPAGIAGAYIDAIETVGIPIDAMAPAPIAILHAIRADGSDAREISLVRAGTGTTDVIVASRDALFFRSDPAGTASISEALSREFGIGEKESNEERREMECARGNPRFLALTEAYADETGARVAAALEFARQLDIKISPAHILLTGEGARIPALAEVLRRRTGIPIELHTKWNRVSIRKQLIGHAITTEFPAFAPAIGAALLAAGGETPALSLVSPRQGREFLRWIPTVAAACLVLGASMFATDRALAWSLRKAEGALLSIEDIANVVKENRLEQIAGASDRERATLETRAWRLPDEWLRWERIVTYLPQAVGAEACILKYTNTVMPDASIETILEFTVPRAMREDGTVESQPRSFESDVAVLFRAWELPEPVLLDRRAVATPVSDAAAADARFDWFKIKIHFNERTGVENSGTGGRAK